MSEHRYCPRCGAELGSSSHGGRPRPSCSAEGCGYVHWDNPVPVVAAIVEREGHVVLVRNRGFPEKWFGLVTGFLERGESPEEGAKREVHEELGLTAEVLSLVGVYPFPPMNQLIVAYHLRASGEITLGEELAEHKLVPIEKLRPWPFATGDAVRDWLARRAG